MYSTVWEHEQIMMMIGNISVLKRHDSMVYEVEESLKNE